MLNLRRGVVGVVAVLLVGAAGCSSPQQTATNLKTGTIVINPQFDLAYSFSDGLAAVLVDYRTGTWGFIDKTGTYAINSQFDVAGSFSEGLAVASISGRYGFIAR